MQIYRYDSGVKTKIDNSSLNLDEISILLNTIIKNTNEFMRLYMDADRFKSLKNDESVIEIILKEEISVLSNDLGELKFKKVLIPLTGDFVGDENSPYVTLFIGDEDYFPEPINNQNGYKDLIKLKAELEKSSQ